MVRSNRPTYDTYGALSESLLQLEDAADKIFTSISDRVRSQHQLLKTLSSRIQAAQAKVDAISGTKRATSVFSSAKYPEIDPSLTDYIPISQKKGDDPTKPFSVTLSLNTGQWQNGEEGTLELFQFFSETSHEHWLKDHKRKEGIGKVPPRVKSVADVLLFNSTDLPFHKYRIVDNLAGAEQPVNEEEVDVKPIILPAPPQSVLGGDETPRLRGAEEYGFRPVLRQVPTFSLPSVLPDLPMVADLSWSGSTGDYYQLPSIAPSALQAGSRSPSTNSMSSRFDSGSVSARFEPANTASRLDSVDGLMLEASSRGLPPIRVSQSPPPERNPRKKATGSFSGSQPSSARSRDGGSKMSFERSRTLRAPTPPPPPPPPPMPAQIARSMPGSSATGPQLMGKTTSNRAGTTSNVPVNAQSLPIVDNQRAALMASIRDSGTNVLRKTTRGEGSVPSLDIPKTSLGGGNEDKDVNTMMSPGAKPPLNVMAEMHKSITLRRMSMMGHEQTALKNENRLAGVDEGVQVSRSGDSGKIPMPDIGSEDDDDDDDSWD